MGLFGKREKPRPRTERTQQRRPTCGQVQGPSHPCALPDDGHTMHRCGHGDCAWGHR